MDEFILPFCYFFTTLAGTTSHLAQLAEQQADKTWSKTGKHKHDQQGAMF